MSVRAAGEVKPALEGGADIIDAKDPSQGALGAMRPVALARVLAQVPDGVPFSAALGDPPDPAAAAALVNGLPARGRSAASYVKLGFAGAASRAAAEAMLRTAVDTAHLHPARPLVIAVAYADDPEGPGLERVALMARRAGAHGVLADTARKDAGSLLQSVSPERLRAWVGAARAEGLLVALAGRLGLADLPAAVDTGADVVGVRGAACDGGREGRISAGRVWGLRAALAGMAEDRGAIAKHQSAPPPAAWPHPERRFIAKG